jgi:hypothetical protein
VCSWEEGREEGRYLCKAYHFVAGSESFALVALQLLVALLQLLLHELSLLCIHSVEVTQLRLQPVKPSTSPQVSQSSHVLAGSAPVDFCLFGAQLSSALCFDIIQSSLQLIHDCRML